MSKPSAASQKRCWTANAASASSARCPSTCPNWSTSASSPSACYSSPPPRTRSRRSTGPVPEGEFARHTQLVLTDRTDLSKGQEFSVLSPRNWRLADLGAKHAFLLAGLGWGGMPHNMVARDLHEGTLKEIPMQDAQTNVTIPMSATYRTDTPPGPAGRWFVEQLKLFAAES